MLAMFSKGGLTVTIGIIPAITTAAYIIAARLVCFILSLAGLSKHETSAQRPDVRNRRDGVCVGRDYRAGA